MAGLKWLFDLLIPSASAAEDLVPNERRPGIFDDIFRDIWDLFSRASETISPIALDLNGDGLHTTTVENGVYFDHAADGFAERSAWIDQNDGFLVRDLNHDNRITSGQELFGSETLLSTGTKAANGFEALAELDSNSDGRIDETDSSFGALRVWRDSNHDGKSSDDELITLGDASVKAIATAFATSNHVDAAGNQLKQQGTFTKLDDNSAEAVDVWFKVDQAFSIATQVLPVSDAVRALPHLKGYGKVYDLHQAIMRDGTGTLQDYVEQFAAASDAGDRNALVQQIIYRWAGVENIAPESRASAINGTGNALDNSITGNAGNNRIDGAAGADTLMGGAGNDLIVGGLGADTLTGGTGVDTFDYNAIGEGLDTIVDFASGFTGDKIDLRDLLIGYVPGSSDMGSFLQLIGTTSTTIAVNADGVGTDFVSLATLTNLGNAAGLLESMVAQGNLIVA